MIKSYTKGKQDGNLIELKIVIPVDELERFNKWLDIANSHYHIRQAKRNYQELMDDVMSDINGGIEDLEG